MMKKLLVMALLCASSACAPTGGPLPPRVSMDEPRRISVENGGLTSVRVYAVSDRNGELYLGKVGAQSTRDFRVAGGMLSNFRLETRPVIEIFPGERHRSDLITAPSEWDVTWILRPSPASSVARISTVSLRHCSAKPSC